MQRLRGDRIKRRTVAPTRALNLDARRTIGDEEVRDADEEQRTVGDTRSHWSGLESGPAGREMDEALSTSHGEALVFVSYLVSMFLVACCTSITVFCLPIC